MRGTPHTGAMIPDGWTLEAWLAWYRVKEAQCRRQQAKAADDWLQRIRQLEARLKYDGDRRAWAAHCRQQAELCETTHPDWAADWQAQAEQLGRS